MKVSVIVPVYNVEKYLSKCLDSLVNQTLHDIEILVVNDGSTDNSQEIISEFQAKFPSRIKSFIKENGGISEARNLGIAHASGDYIGFVDGDDFAEATMFEELYLLAEKHDACLAFCNLQKVSNGKTTQKLPQMPNLPEFIDLKDDFSVFSDISYFACNKIFKKHLFGTLRFKKDVHFEDIELIPKLLLDSLRIVHTPSYLYNYSERLDSISRTHTERGLEILSAVESVETYFSTSRYRENLDILRGFQILEGVYTYLAYLAFVKDDETYWKLSGALKKFIKNRSLKRSEIILYQRFGINYLLSLPLKKRVYYLLWFFGFEKLLRRLL